MRDMLNSLLEPIFAALGMAIAGFLVAILMRVAKRLGIQITTEREQAISQASQRAVLAAAEWGAKQAATTGEEKLAKATEAVMAKFPKLKPNEVDTHIHAAVAELGVGAASVAGVLPGGVDAKPATSPPPIPLPPPIRSGGESGRASSAALIYLAFGALLAAWMALPSGCCSSAEGSATCARKAVTGMYTVIGAASVISRPALKTCEDNAVKLVAEGHDAAGDAALQQCRVARNGISEALNTSVNAAAATGSAIDAGEAISTKSYASALAPLYAAGRELAAALASAGIKIPFSIPGVL